MKKTARFLALVCVLTSAIGCVGCKGGGGNKRDETKTLLEVYNYDGGIGTEWLYNAEKRFEALYAETSFEEGKMGVNVEITPTKTSLDGIANSSYDVYFTEQVWYNDLIAQDLLLDITDLVTAPMTNVLGCTEDTTIENKLVDEQISALTAIDGKHYVLPHYECYSGVSYDRGLFNQKSLFIKKNMDGSATKFCNLEGDLSVGPDGIANTYDDGLPSSYEEFYALMNQMVKYNVDPFIYTGQYATYTNNLATCLWAAYTGKDEFMLNVNFDSSYDLAEGEEPVSTEIVVDWDGDTPITAQRTITPETGYLVGRQAGKYHALSFLRNVLYNSKYTSSKISETSTHLDAQTDYIFSALEGGRPIAMIIEGSYWYNEAKDSLNAAANMYPSTGKDRDFAFMPMPTQVSGQVQEGQGKKNTLLDVLSSFAFINNNIKNEPVTVDVAKKFLQFCYTDAELLHFTETTSIFKAVEYKVEKSVFDSMSKYAQHVYELREASDIIHPISNSKIFVNAQSIFNYAGTSDGWASIVNGTPYKFAYNGFKAGVTAKDYFKGLWISESDWNNSYGEYFN